MRAPPTRVCPDRPVADSAREDLGLLLVELLLRQHARGLQLAELLQLLELAAAATRCNRRRLGRGLRLLLRPARRLSAGDPVRDRGRRPGDDGGPGDAAKQSWHG